MAAARKARKKKKTARKGRRSAQRPRNAQARTLLWNLQQANATVRAHWQIRIEALGLTPSQAEVLRALDQHDNLSLNRLRDYLTLTEPPSRPVDDLVRRKLVSRQTDEQDRRKVRLNLTSKGRSHLVGIRRAEDNLAKFLLDRLGNAPLATINAALAKLV